MKGITTVTVSVPLVIRRRGGRKDVIAPDGTQIRPGEREQDGGFIPVQGDPVLIKSLARGFRWRRLLEEGRYASVRELALAEKVDRAYVGRVLRLTLMRPKEIEAAVGECQRDWKR